MQHLGLSSIIVYWILVSSILYTWGIDTRKTISDHVATGKQKKIYTPLAITYLVLISAFLFDWFLPALNADFYHYVLLIVSIIFLFLTFIVPRHGKTVKTHDVFVTVVACAIWVMTASLVVAEVNGYVAYVSMFLLFSMLVAGVLLAKRGRENYLQTEVFYFAAFHALVLLLTYTRPL